MSTENKDTRTLADRLAAAQANMVNPYKTAKNDHFKSHYAPLDVLRDAVVPALAAEGIAVIQEPGFSDGAVTLRTVLLCGDTERDCGTLAIPVNTGRGNPAHAVGSALTYMRRYSLEAVAGICGTADDDGNAAGRHAPPPRKQSRKAELMGRAKINRENAAEVMRYLGANYALPDNADDAAKIAALEAFDARHGLHNLIDAAAEWAARQDASDV